MRLDGIIPALVTCWHFTSDPVFASRLQSCRHPWRGALRVRLFHFPLPVEFFDILEKYKTSYITVREYVFLESERHFFGSISIFLSPAVSAPLSGNWPNCRLKNMQMPKPVEILNCTLCQSLLSEVLLGLLCSALKRQTFANFGRAELKPLETDLKKIFNPKLAVRPPVKHFLSPWYVNSYNFWVFPKVRWAKESEETNAATLHVPS